MKRSQHEQLRRLRDNLYALAESIREDEEPPIPGMEYYCDCDRRALSIILKVEGDIVADSDDKEKTFSRYFK